jgi:hypothetical protein
VTIGEERLGETGWAWITSASAEIVLADGQAVRTGEFVLMNSTEIDRTVELAKDDAKEVDTAWGKTRIQCVQRNIGKLEEALRAPGTHSPSIQLLLNRLNEIGYTTGGLRTTPTAPPTATTTRSAPPAAPPPYLNTWIARLASLPRATTRPAQLQTKVADLQRQTGTPIQSSRSESYGSLMPGYWILFYPGEFSDGHDALGFCTNHGINDKKLCADRYLSASTNDRELNCHFSDPRDSAKCTRP